MAYSKSGRENIFHLMMSVCILPGVGFKRMAGRHAKNLPAKK